jgi:hypothetical protein
MKVYTRPFVTPLSAETQDTIRLLGSGSYIQYDRQRLLLTCEHVARNGSVHYRFHGSDDVFEYPGPWTMDPHPIDAAAVRMSDTEWEVTHHLAAAVPQAKFAMMHRLSQQAEPLFFRGYAGENADYAFGVHQTNATGYCSQEVANSGDSEIFEIFRDPQQADLTQGTSPEARSAKSFDDPQGFSGSLVWKTRYLEVQASSRTWTPDDAVITGLLRRWDT